MPNFVMLLAPSEGKRPGGNPFAPDMFDYRASNTFNYFHDLNPERRALIKRLQLFLRDADEQAQSKVLGVQGAHLEAAIRANANIYEAPLMAALERYSPGVMYKAMNFPGLPTGAQRRLLEQGIIFSGLFGLLRPDDLIPMYRLRMGASLPKVGSITQYWKPHITPLLNERLEGRIVWNLLPNTHQETWEDEHTYAHQIKVRFEQETDEGRKVVTHGVKPLRGQLVSFIVRDAGESPDMLKDEEWSHPAGYVYDEAASSMDEETKTETIVLVKRA